MCSPNIEELFDLKSSFLPVKKKNNKKNHLDFKFCSSGGGGGEGGRAMLLALVSEKPTISKMKNTNLLLSHSITLLPCY